MKVLKRIWAVMVYFYNRFQNDNCANHAGALAYSTLLSLVPMLVIVFWVLSYFPMFKGTGEDIQEFILSKLAANSANTVSEHLHVFLSQMINLSWLNILSFGITSLLLIYNLVISFNDIWHTRLRKHIVITFFIYGMILLFSPLFFGVLILLTSYLASLPYISTATTTIFTNKFFLLFVSFFTSFLTFSFLNWALPSCKVHLRPALIAGFITAILYELARYAFALYISYFPSYRVIYGALATIPIFLVWMYVTWMIILFGAIICHSINQHQFKKISLR